jgi:hypothetical protein
MVSLGNTVEFASILTKSGVWPMNFRRTILLTSVALTVPCVAAATTLGPWNEDNVVRSTAFPVEDVTDYSVVYQGNPTTAETNGRIAYTPFEAIDPGMEALNDFYTSGPGGSRVFDGCIRAEVGGSDCATGFQTGNRFKLQLTDTGAVDLVFNINPADPGTQGLNPGNPDEGPGIATPGINTYQVFGRAVNLTTQMLDSFVIELGSGVGDNFIASTDGDGLSFAQGLSLGPNGDTAFTQYPFGLFGSLDQPNPSPNPIAGFFDNDGRAGFEVAVEADGAGEDRIVSGNYYGTYDDIFGNWLSQEMAPEGLLWDNDGDAGTDALVMAWFNQDLGKWETLREVVQLLDDDNNPFLSAIASGSQLYDSAEDAAIALGLVGGSYEVDGIEDVANLNLNFGIELADNFLGFGNGLGSDNTFTLRLTSSAAMAPIPLPASVLLLLAGVGSLGAVRRLSKAGVARS